MKVYAVIKFYHDYEELSDIYKDKKDAEKRAKELTKGNGGDIFRGARVEEKELK